MEAAVVSDKKPKLLDRVRSDLRVKHYSIRTERAYIDWIRRFILFHGKRHPNEMGEQEISAFLTHLAVDRHVAASTQNQALCALLFLYQQVLQLKLDFIDDVARVKRPAKIPVVFTREEARAVLDQLEGEYQLMSELLYLIIKNGARAFLRFGPFFLRARASRERVGARCGCTTDRRSIVGATATMAFCARCSQCSPLPAVAELRSRHFGERESAWVFTSRLCLSTTRRNSRSIVLKASWITLLSGLWVPLSICLSSATSS
jgi:hypothetical protein